MPPRYAYWTILIDDKPTAFRAREREELQPTFVQLQRKNANVTMRWFARGKLWDSREAEQEDFQGQKRAALEPRDRRAERAAGVERRGGDWRPGGTHKDPRDRFKKKNRPERAWSEKDPATQRDRDKPGYVAKKPWQKPDVAQGFSPAKSGGERQPWRDKPAGPPRGDRPWKPKGAQGFSPAKPAGEGKPPWSGKPRDRKPWDNKPAVPNDRPWQTKPTGPRAQRKPWVGKPSGDGPRSDRPWSNRPPDRSGAPRERKPWTDKPAGGPPRGDRPWSGKPPDRSGPPRERKPWTDKPAGGPPRGDRPWTPKPPSGEKRPWSGKPSGPPRGDRPWTPKPPAGDRRPWSGKPSSGGDRPRDPRRGSSDRPPGGGGWQKKPFTPRGPRPGGGDAPRKRRDDED